MFSYFLGSDTFHVALKYGVFSSWQLSSFLFLLAGLVFLVCFVAALLFSKKGKAAKEETRLVKGVMLKRMVQGYSAIYAVFLGLSFLLSLGFSLYTTWGSQILCLVLGVNLILPVISISLFKTEDLKKNIGSPSETDRFMMRKGGNVSFKDA